MGWVFQGSPEKFDIDDSLSRYPELIYWRTPKYTKDIAVGDRVFVWRAGEESGAVAIGTVVEAPVPRATVSHPEALGDDLWVAEKPDPDEFATAIHIDEIRLGVKEDMLPRDLVKNDLDLGSISLIRMPNASVFKLTDAETKVMERLWVIQPSTVSAHSIQEGERQLRAHYRRERSPRLRKDNSPRRCRRATRRSSSYTSGTSRSSAEVSPWRQDVAGPLHRAREGPDHQLVRESGTGLRFIS